MIVLRPADDASPADWVAAGIRGFAESVLSLVPDGFEAYVRVCHPPYLEAGRTSWTEIAAAHGKRVHAGMQLHAIGGTGAEGTCTGHLPPEVVAPLADILARHTATPRRCYFAFWEGLGRLPEEVAAAPSFELPKRRYHLLTGPVDAASEPALGRLRPETANLWWPGDHAWCVATEIDLHSTYIACGNDCAVDVCAAPGLEALPVPPDTGITFDSDTVN